MKPQIRKKQSPDIGLVLIGIVVMTGFLMISGCQESYTVMEDQNTLLTLGVVSGNDSNDIGQRIDPNEVQSIAGRFGKIIDDPNIPKLPKLEPIDNKFVNDEIINKQ